MVQVGAQCTYSPPPLPAAVLDRKPDCSMVSDGTVSSEPSVLSGPVLSRAPPPEPASVTVPSKVVLRMTMCSGTYVQMYAPPPSSWLLLWLNADPQISS